MPRVVFYCDQCRRETATLVTNTKTTCAVCGRAVAPRDTEGEPLVPYELTHNDAALFLRKLGIAPD